MFDSLVFYELCDFFNQTGFIYLIRNLGKYDLHFSSRSFLKFVFGTYFNLSLPRTISFSRRISAENLRSCRKVRSLNDIDEILDIAVFVIDHTYCCIYDISQVMRRNRRSHTHGNTRCTIH